MHWCRLRGLQVHRSHPAIILVDRSSKNESCRRPTAQLSSPSTKGLSTTRSETARRIPFIENMMRQLTETILGNRGKDS